MSAIIYILDTLLGLALFVVMARLLLQWTRADFRNPLCQGIVKAHQSPGPAAAPRAAAAWASSTRPRSWRWCWWPLVKVASLYWLADVPLPPPALVWVRAVVIGDRAHAAVDLFLRDRALCAAQHDRPGRLFAAAVTAHVTVRTGAAPDPAHDPGHQRTGPVAPVGRHRDPGAAHPAALAQIHWNFRPARARRHAFLFAQTRA